MKEQEEREQLFVRLGVACREENDEGMSSLVAASSELSPNATWRSPGRARFALRTAEGGG